MKNKVKIFYNNNDKSINTFNEVKDKLIKNGFNMVENDYNIAIAIGGDGSFLRMVKETNFKSDVLYLGINTGTLGFAQEIHVNELDELIENLKTGNYKVNEFGVQETNLYSNNENSKFYSLNDIVIRDMDLNTLKLDIFIDDALLEHFAGDGILVSTSFGSTAYNLSFRGSIIYNTFHALELTPVAPLNNKTYRTLTNSLVLPQNKNIEIVPVSNKNLIVTIDGENKYYENVDKIDTILSDKTIMCYQNIDYNFVKKINDKFLSN
jgi:probable inorganic polyphosphate/ATP-NAD kinase